MSSPAPARVGLQAAAIQSQDPHDAASLHLIRWRFRILPVTFAPLASANKKKPRPQRTGASRVVPTSYLMPLGRCSNTSNTWWITITMCAAIRIQALKVSISDLLSDGSSVSGLVSLRRSRFPSWHGTRLMLAERVCERKKIKRLKIRRLAICLVCDSFFLPYLVGWACILPDWSRWCALSKGRIATWQGDMPPMYWRACCSGCRSPSEPEVGARWLASHTNLYYTEVWSRGTWIASVLLGFSIKAGCQRCSDLLTVRLELATREIAVVSDRHRWIEDRRRGGCQIYGHTLIWRRPGSAPLLGLRLILRRANHLHVFEIADGCP